MIRYDPVACLLVPVRATFVMTKCFLLSLSGHRPTDSEGLDADVTCASPKSITGQVKTVRTRSER